MSKSKPTESRNLVPVALMTPGKVMLLGTFLLLESSLATPTLLLLSLPGSQGQILLLVVPSTTSEAGRCPLCALVGGQLGIRRPSLSTQGHAGFGDR